MKTPFFSLLLAASCAYAGAGAGDTLEVRGVVQAARQIDVKPDVPGRIRKLHVHAGDRVKKGDLLVEMDQEETFEKVKLLAPDDGTVITLPVIEGQFVRTAAEQVSGTTLMTLADLSELFVCANVPQKKSAWLAVKKPVQVALESAPEEKWDAAITFISPIATVRNSARGVEIQARIERPDPRLRPGMSVNLSIPNVARAKLEPAPPQPKR